MSCKFYKEFIYALKEYLLHPQQMRNINIHLEYMQKRTLTLHLYFIHKKNEDARLYDMTAWAKSPNAYTSGYTFTSGLRPAPRLLQASDVAVCSERGGLVLYALELCHFTSFFFRLGVNCNLALD